MCGRYAFSRVDKQLLERLGLAAAQLPPGLGPRYNQAPGQDAAALRVAGAGLQLDFLRWGLPKPGQAGALLINARLESAATLPTFRESWRQRRCALPADGWYEWLKEGKRRRPHFIQPDPHRAVLLAGLWQPGSTGTGAFVILTRPALPAIAHIHDRMPLILPEEGWRQWLQGDDAPLPDWPGSRLECWEVEARVNGVGVDDAALLEPVQAAQGRLF